MMKVMIVVFGLLVAGDAFSCEEHRAEAQAPSKVSTRKPASVKQKKTPAPQSVACVEWGDDRQECVDHGCHWNGSSCHWNGSSCQ